jgi:hypothetical protein
VLLVQISSEGHAEAVQVTKHSRHPYLGQLREFADILLTTEQDKTGQQIHKSASGHTGCDAARYNMTAWEAG